MSIKFIVLWFMVFYNVHTWFSSIIFQEKLSSWTSKQKNVAKLVKEKPDAPHMERLSFLLQPVNGEAKFIRNTSLARLKSKQKPRLSLDMRLEEISLQLDKQQYKQMLSVGSEIVRNEKRAQYRSGRPQQPIKIS